MLLKEPKILPTGVIATWSEVVRTEMDYKGKSSKATVYYYLDEQAFLDGKEAVLGEVIEVPFVEQIELEKTGVTAKIVAEEAMVTKLEAPVEVVLVDKLPIVEKPVEPVELPVEELIVK